MGFLDVFTKELPESWEEPAVKKWKEAALSTLKSYYTGFRDSQFDEYQCPEDNNLLLAKICYALCGPPTKEADELCDGYTDEQKKSGQEIVDKIIESYKDVSHSSLLVGIIKIVCKQGETEFEMPLFSVFVNGDPTDATASRIFIDSQLRVYKSWDDWKKTNTLPMLKYAYPRRGFFTSSTECCYEFDPTKDPDIEFGTSPQCDVSARIFRTTDAVSIVTILGCGAIAVASIFTPIGPAFLMGTAITGSFGVYGTARAVQRLYDKGTHSESMIVLESFTLYFSILATPLHFTTTIVNAQLIRGATANGRIFSNSVRMFATILNFSTLGVDAVLVGCGFANLIDKFQKDQLTTLDVVQFSMSVFFFTNTLIKPQTAKAIIENAQDRHIQQFANTMSDNEARATFDKFVADNSVKGAIVGKSNIIRTINRIENANSVFGELKAVETIKIGDRKGKSLMVSETTRISLRSLEGSNNKQDSTNVNVTFKASLKSKLNLKVKDKQGNEIVIDPEDFKVDGERIFMNLEDFQKTRVKSVFDEVGKSKVEIIMTAFKIVKEFENLTHVSTLDKVLSLIEIVSAEVNARSDQARTTVADVCSRVRQSEFLSKLKCDINTANNVAAKANLKFSDELKAVYYYRKHGNEFPLKSWNPNTEPLPVYLKNFPDYLISNKMLTEFGIDKAFYVAPENQFAVVISKQEDSNICSMYVKPGTNDEYLEQRAQMNAANYSVNLDDSLVHIINHDLPKFISEITGYSANQNLNIAIILECGQQVHWKDLEKLLNFN